MLRRDGRRSISGASSIASSAMSPCITGRVPALGPAPRERCLARRLSRLALAGDDRPASGVRRPDVRRVSAERLPRVSRVETGRQRCLGAARPARETAEARTVWNAPPGGEGRLRLGATSDDGRWAPLFAEMSKVRSVSLQGISPISSEIFSASEGQSFRGRPRDRKVKRVKGDIRLIKRRPKIWCQAGSGKS